MSVISCAETPPAFIASPIAFFSPPLVSIPVTALSILLTASESWPALSANAVNNNWPWAVCLNSVSFWAINSCCLDGSKSFQFLPLFAASYSSLARSSADFPPRSFLTIASIKLSISSLDFSCSRFASSSLLSITSDAALSRYSWADFSLVLL